MLCLVTETFGPVPEVGQKAKLDWQPLQFATTYRVRAFREKTAARKAWNLLLSGSRPTHLLTSDGPHFSVIFESVPHSTTRVAAS